MLHDNGIPAELCTTQRSVPKESGTIKRRQWKWKEEEYQWLTAGASTELTGLFEGCNPEGGLRKYTSPSLNLNHKH